MHRTIMLAAFAVLAVTALTSPANAICLARPDMTGEWKGSDGGTYQMRQHGNKVWWVGRSADGGKQFTNVFSGTRDGRVVTGRWADVKGNGFGTLVLDACCNPPHVLQIRKVSQTGSGFAAQTWGAPCPDTN